jgi:dUTP pyrophosphatase
MGEISEKIKELEYLLSLDALPNEQKKEIKQALELMNSVTYFKKEKNDKIKIKFINKSENKNPLYEKIGDSGFDLRSNEDGTLKPLERKLVSTGLYFELPDGYELQIRPRSGLAYKNGITVLNSPGTVDTGYRGEIKVLLINLSNEEFTWEKGERIAQGVVSPRVSSDYGDLIEVKEISQSERGEGGFGSTGTK